jgi:mannose-6-phosphate isomerase-like protein (cupin superfamily)
MIPVALCLVVAAHPSNLEAQRGGAPDSATDITAADVQAVSDSPSGGIDRQIKIVDVGEANIAVGVLHRGELENDGGPANGLVHERVTEVYYITSGGGTLVTGGTVSKVRDYGPDSGVVTLLVGPSYLSTSVGGRSRDLSVGDIVVIPAGVFHAWSEIPDHVTYLSYRPDLDKVLPGGYVNPALGEQPPGK